MHVLFYLCESVDNGAMRDALFEAAAEGELVHGSDEGGAKRVVDASLYVDAVSAHARLSRGAELRGDGASEAASRSASLKTMKGLFPPSSKESFLRVDEDCCMSSLLTLVLPMKEIFLTVGEVQSTRLTAGVLVEAVMMFTTPFRMPTQ